MREGRKKERETDRVALHGYLQTDTSELLKDDGIRNAKSTVNATPLSVKMVKFGCTIPSPVS